MTRATFAASIDQPGTTSSSVLDWQVCDTNIKSSSSKSSEVSQIKEWVSPESHLIFLIWTWINLIRLLS